jgi:glycosyltransferase involved in cell wall biosynthesis
MKINFSIITPTWNRVRYIDRLWDTLSNQKFKNFEWIVADDGSSDGTNERIKFLASKSDFSIIFIRSDIHVGKVTMDNAAIRESSGELILWCDSDDWLLPNTLQSLWENWTSIPLYQRNSYVGLTALAATKSGVLVKELPNIKDVSWNDLSEVHKIKNDMLFCVRSRDLKKHPFPEVDLVIPESVVWTALGNRPTRLVHEVLKMVEYHADHAISFNGTMSYCRGRAYSLAITARNLSGYQHSFKISSWRTINFIRYCLHGEISMQEMVQLWRNNTSIFAILMAYPFSILLCLKDYFQGKVRLTHREFLEAKNKAIFTIDLLSDCNYLCNKNDK